jgi:hypothetical protein
MPRFTELTVPPWAAIRGGRESKRRCTGQGFRWLARISFMALF